MKPLLMNYLTKYWVNNMFKRKLKIDSIIMMCSRVLIFLTSSNLFIVTGFLLLIVEEADSRVGGGHSYGRGRSSGGSSSGGWSSGSSSYNGYNNGGGAIFEMIYWFIRICVRYPAFGIPLLLVIFYLIYSYRKNLNKYSDYYSTYGGNSNTSSKETSALANRTREYISIINQNDSNFSFPIFKDFIFSLYSQLHEFRAQNKIENLSLFFSEELLQRLQTESKSLKSVDEVVIGNCQIVKVSKDKEFLQVKILFTANYTEFYKDGSSKRFVLKDTWQLRRSVGAVSKAPEKISAHNCPNCGASNESISFGKCQRCGVTNQEARLDWLVYDISSVREAHYSANNLSPMLSGQIIEEGTQLPTLRDPQIDISVKEFFPVRDELEYARKRFEEVFLNLQKAWSEQKWELARPFETDALFQSHYFWIEDYKRKLQRNHIEKVNVQKIVPVALYNDKYYLSFTVRIFAEMIDYTKDQKGKLISGSNSRKINFTEYWTFIKGIGYNHKDAKTKSMLNCPSCGAGLKISMAGNCEFCSSKITLGQFDWVLSQIEQDEEFNLG
ncbi:MAG: TIM44-like domain-containing protein [Bdellovibrionaceae bacterium]|nr:TIM44-like domain-containing protein [Pseudobdellovibrionaceae bacterium]NUM58872.1 TIM44-like domain-containing protein [Pseudobdellovibrionaceae bacterium]